jgi:hypothetical protein
VNAPKATPVRNVVARPPAARIEHVIVQMRALGRALPRSDGIAAFTGLYLAVTESIAEHARAGTYEDAAFVRAQDVGFANLYFDALRAWDLGAAVPRAWAPLFAARSNARVTPLQFALAGMNAHINRDLPVALVRTCAARGVGFGPRSPQRRDYRLINTLLAETEARVKSGFLTGGLASADDALGQLDDVVAMWKVEHAREAAWVNARTLWTLRGNPRLEADFLRALDRMVGFAGRGLLRPL